MKISIVSIQKNRGPWLLEWILFHHVVGVSNFYIYLHNCSDNSKLILDELSNFFNITYYLVDWNDRAQIRAYQHAYDNFNHCNDWLAFIDGDEFLFPVKDQNLNNVLLNFQYSRNSGLCPYWVCFGSNYHISEPDGLIIENYTRRAPLSFVENKHIKSIVKGRQANLVQVTNTPHFFLTPYPLVDENWNVMESGISKFDPSHTTIRINHYTTQSLEFYNKHKMIGSAMDLPQLVQLRDSEWFAKYDQNQVLDTDIQRFLPDVKTLYNKYLGLLNKSL